MIAILNYSFNFQSVWRNYFLARYVIFYFIFLMVRLELKEIKIHDFTFFAFKNSCKKDFASSVSLTSFLSFPSKAFLRSIDEQVSMESEINVRRECSLSNRMISKNKEIFSGWPIDGR